MNSMQNNVDDLLLGREAQKAEEIAKEMPKVEANVEETEEKLTYTEQFRKDKAEVLAKQESEVVEEAPKEPEKVEKDEVKDEIQPETEEVEELQSSKSDDIDEYGNQLPKARTYTEEEVQRMIRDRLTRGRQQEPAAQPTQQQVQQAKQEGFEADSNSEESWDVQLANFIDKRLEAREQQTQKQQWQQREQKLQADFEAKFTTGMQKYKDFSDVVAGKPITNEMMMAARSMKDPAAFIYAAAKQQPKELERIAQIPDAYQQAAEIGRLEERMRKARKTSAAPKPVTKTKGDISGKDNGKVSVDQLIQYDAKRKLSRRQGR
jgi:hypothetical protein